jgi:hypothetical protein
MPEARRCNPGMNHRKKRFQGVGDRACTHREPRILTTCARRSLSQRNSRAKGDGSWAEPLWKTAHRRIPSEPDRLGYRRCTELVRRLRLPDSLLLRLCPVSSGSAVPTNFSRDPITPPCFTTNHAPLTLPHLGANMPTRGGSGESQLVTQRFQVQPSANLHRQDNAK